MDTDNFENIKQTLEKKEVVLQETITKVHNLRKTVAELEQSNNIVKDRQIILEIERDALYNKVLNLEKELATKLIERDDELYNKVLNLQKELDTKSIERETLYNKVLDLQNELDTKLIERETLYNKVLDLQNRLGFNVETELNLIKRKRDINAKKRK